MVTSAILFALAVNPVIGATITVLASRDNTLVEDATGGLSNGAGMHLFTGRTGQASNSIRRGLVAFDLSTISTQAKVTSVALTMHITRSASVALQEVRLHRARAAWGEGSSVGGAGEGAGAAATEGDATWIRTGVGSNSWTTPGGDFEPVSSAAAVVGSMGPVVWEATPQLVADVQNWIDTPSTSNGWVLVTDESVARTAKRFASRQFPVESMQPSLTVTYDEPTPIQRNTWSHLKTLYR